MKIVKRDMIECNVISINGLFYIRLQKEKSVEVNGVKCRNPYVILC